MTTGRALREGSAQKRAAILAAAHDLFLTDGFDRSSVDAVAARAGVSKRTVYDYFGDKLTLLRAVVDEAGRSLTAKIRRAFDDTVRDDLDAAELEDALTAFALRIATEMLGSAEFAALHRLVAEAEHLPHANQTAVTSEPEEALGERLGSLARSGLLHVPDPRLAADHFIALTFMVALNRLRAANLAADPRVRPLFAEGVRAFLRAYRPATQGPGQARRG